MWRSAARETATAPVSPAHEPECFCSDCAYAQGRADALREAEAAVEAVENADDSSTEWDRDYEVDPSGNTRNPRIWIREATAAIRALMEPEVCKSLATSQEPAYKTEDT